MGRDKASLPFGHETLLDRVIHTVTAVADPVVVAAGPSQPVPGGVRVIRDERPGEGPLPALVGALALVKTTYTLVLACDLPLLRPGALSLLVELCKGWEGAVPVVNGRRLPTCAVFETAALERVAEGFGDPRNRSLRDFIEPLRLLEVPAQRFAAVDPLLRSFEPCNTPEEYDRLLGLAGLGTRN